ncbi:MAG: hypothetical protein ACREKG_03835 [Candidatus Rokuibacteriota bacterium]
MKAIKALVLATTAILTIAPMAAPAPAVAVSAPSGIDPRIRLDWDAGTRRGKPLIQGYVYNDHGRPATDVRLLVETLDASGAVIARTIGFVHGIVPFDNRAYFEVPIKATGPSYRVTVTSLDWRGGGPPGP